MCEWTARVSCVNTSMTMRAKLRTIHLVKFHSLFKSHRGSVCKQFYNDIDFFVWVPLSLRAEACNVIFWKWQLFQKVATSRHFLKSNVLDYVYNSFIFIFEKFHFVTDNQHVQMFEIEHELLSFNGLKQFPNIEQCTKS